MYGMNSWRKLCEIYLLIFLFNVLELWELNVRFWNILIPLDSSINTKSTTLFALTVIRWVHKHAVALIQLAGKLLMLHKLSPFRFSLPNNGDVGIWKLIPFMVPKKISLFRISALKNVKKNGKYDMERDVSSVWKSWLTPEWCILVCSEECACVQLSVWKCKIIPFSWYSRCQSLSQRIS